MKNYILTLIIFIALAGCQKIEVEKQNINTFDQVRSTTKYLETRDNYDIYVDAKGQKIFIPTLSKSGAGGAIKIGGRCDKKLEIAGGPGCYYYICENPGRTCRKSKDGEIILCGGCIEN